MKQATTVNIDNTADLSVPMLEVHRIDKTPRGEFRILNIINYLRQFLTDDELLHFNRLSTAFAGEYDEDNEWQQHTITMSDLSITRQLSIYERIESKYTRTREIFLSSRFFYYYIEDHFFSTFGCWPRQPLQSNTFRHYVLKDKQNVTISEVRLKQLQEKANELFTNISIPYSEERVIFKYLPYRLLLILEKASWPLYCLFLLIAPPLIFYYTYRSTHMNYQCNELSHRADIKILQMNIWSGKYITNMVPCDTALTNTTISLQQNFSQLMYMAGFCFNVTNLTLATCLTLFNICKNQDDFFDNSMTVTDQIMVGCHYVNDDCNEKKEIDSFLLYFGTIVLMPIASLIFGFVALFCYGRYCQSTKVARHVSNFFDVLEKLQEAQDSCAIVPRTSPNNHHSLTEDLRRSQMFFKTIGDKTKVELQAIQSKDERAQVPAGQL